MRYQDGGAHYDETITDPTYEAAVKGELTGFSVEIAPGKTQHVPGGLEVTMRQIAEEFKMTLDGVDPIQGISRPSMFFRAPVGTINLKLQDQPQTDPPSVDPELPENSK